MASYRSVRQVLSNAYDSTNQALKTTATISGDVNVDANSVDTSGFIGKPTGSNADFTTAYASAETITCSGLPVGLSSLLAADIVSIQQVSNTGAVTATFTRDDIALTAAGTDPTTLTVTGASFAATDTFTVYTNISRVDYLIKSEGTAHLDTDKGTMPLAVRQDTLAALSDDGDYTPLSTDDEGALYVLDTTLSGVENTEDAAITANGLAIVSEAKSSQKTAVADGDAVIPVTNLNGEVVNAGHTWATNSERSEEIDPLSQHYITETLVDETNITTNTTTYAYFDMNGYKNFSLQGETSGTTPTDVLTVTIEATDQDDGTAPASCTYQDVTNALFGVASWVDTDFFGIVDTDVAFKYVRVKYVTSNDSGDDCDLTVYAKRMY